jgi:hypothetical protein
MMEYHIAPCVGNIHLIPTYLCEIAQDSFLVCVFSAKAKRNMGELAQSTHTTLSKRFYSVQTLYQNPELRAKLSTGRIAGVCAG